MVDKFDALLSQFLAPPERGPDRLFIARVQAQITFARQLQVHRRNAVTGALVDIAAIVALTCGVLWFAQAPNVTTILDRSPTGALLAVLCGFTLVTIVLNSGAGARLRPLT